MPGLCHILYVAATRTAWRSWLPDICKLVFVAMLSHFAKLHKVLKRRFVRLTTAPLPHFPAKYHLMDRRGERNQGLSIYMPRLLEMCATLFTAQRMPELEELLTLRVKSKSSARNVRMLLVELLQHPLEM